MQKYILLLAKILAKSYSNATVQTLTNALHSSAHNKLIPNWTGWTVIILLNLYL